jgi:hypothetical protein
MTEATTSTLWKTLNADWDESDPEHDTIIVTVHGIGGVYVSALSGPKGMDSHAIVGALRAATAALIAASGGDVSTVGARFIEADDALLDTGDQRAN